MVSRLGHSYKFRHQIHSVSTSHQFTELQVLGLQSLEKKHEKNCLHYTTHKKSIVIDTFENYSACPNKIM